MKIKSANLQKKMKMTISSVTVFGQSRLALIVNDESLMSKKRKSNAAWTTFLTAFTLTFSCYSLISFFLVFHLYFTF